MSDNFKYFPRLFGEIITSIRGEYDPVNGLKPAYEFGTYLELTKRIALKDRNIAAGEVAVKYPLVWLVWGANENTENWTSPDRYEISPRIFICNSTDENLSSDARYTNNFEAILFPILDLMMYYFNCKNEVIGGSHREYSKSDHLYWGNGFWDSKDKNVLFDTLDAVELKFSNLIIKKH